jgi:sugar phosphate isomerase/epimerase
VTLPTQLNRRSFLARSFAAAALAPLSRLWADPLNIPAGIQLYTVADPLRNDLQGTLKQLYSIGYRNVEAFGYASRPAPAEFRHTLDEAGLRCPSAHLNFNQTELAPIFAEAHALGASYAVSSTILPEDIFSRKPIPANVMETLTSDDYHHLAERLNKVAAQTRAAGLQYAYHNHNFEFRVQPNQEIGYDILLKNTDPQLVKFEIDCGWMILAGYDPIQYMKQYPGRFRMLHIKDFVKGTEKSTSNRAGQRPEGTELSRGRIDYKPIFAAAANHGIQYYFVEQEPPFPAGISPLEAARIDYDYLHAL